MTGDFEMKKMLFAAVAAAALAAAQPVAAADLGARYNYNKAPAYAAPIWTWTGFYVGAHVGGEFSASNSFNGLVLSDYDARFMGGVQAGADWQFSGNWVVGAEGQYSWLSRNNANALFPGGFVYGNDQRALASITARLGYSFGPTLVYVKGGYAYADNRDVVTFAGVPVAFTLDGNHNHGWTIGGGAEYMFTPSWSVKGEYQYYNFGHSRFLAPAALVPFGTFHNDEHTLKVGVNYRFNFSSPVVARY
jgi:outer membrane immunogenic protein